MDFMETINEQKKQKQCPEFYYGFLVAVQQLSFDKGQAGVQFSPTNFEKLMDLVEEYKSAEERRQTVAKANLRLQKQVMTLEVENYDMERRIRDLESHLHLDPNKFVFPKLPAMQPPYVSTTTVTPMYDADGNNRES